MDALLLLGAALRLTRLVTVDDLGAMLVREPAHELAHRRGTPTAHRLADGVECPFCVGQWVCFSVLGGYALARRRPATLAAWRFVATGLTVNYLTAHLSSRID